MPTHIREKIVDQLVAVLRTVGTGDPAQWAYNYPGGALYVDTVKKNNLNVGTFPHCLVAIGNENYVQRGICGRSRIYGKTMQVVLACGFKYEDSVRESSNILHDLETVLGENQFLTLDSVDLAQDTRITNNITFYDEGNEGIGGLTLTLEVDYGYEDGVPDTRR